MTRVAVIGCGYWGKNLVRNFHQLGALAAINDANAQLAREFSQKYEVPCDELNRLLRADHIDAVVIAAPAVEHAKLVRDALEADKHVFVEKPLALTIGDAERLCEAAEQRGLVLMVGHLLQYHSAFQRLKQLVAGGELGRLQYAYSNRLNLGKVRREENILWSFAPHDISMILSLVGAEPETVLATGACYLNRSVADVTTTNLAFANGVNAHVFVSWLHPFKEQKLVVVGDRAMAVFDDGQPWQSKLLLYRHTVEWHDQLPVANRAEPTAVPVEQVEPLAQECRHFLDCVARGTRARTDGREGLDVLRVLDAAERSMKSGQAERLTPRQAPARYSAHPSAVIDEGCHIGAGTRIWHFSHILGGSRIGDGCTIGQNVMIGPDVAIGKGCKIQNNVSIYKGVTLEDGVFCGPSCVFTNVKTPRAEVNRKEEFLPTVVERGASIGANATIVCGSRLGAYCLIAAGAVVTGDVPPFALMAGVPARRIGWVSRTGDRLGDDLVCPRTGKRHHLLSNDMLEEI